MEHDLSAAAFRYHLDPLIVAGLVQVESGFNPNAWNPEPRYRYFWNVKTHKPFRVITTLENASEYPPKDFPSLAGDPDQEWWAQQASWGLCQVMGAVAREHGFAGEYLTQLCSSPITNLDIGCEHLAQLLTWAKGDVQQALAAYNGGKFQNDKRPFRNQLYALKVIMAKDTFMKETRA